MVAEHSIFDKGQARLAFGKAADTYDEAAVLQREIAGRMLERLDLVRLQPEVVLDVGSGTGEATAALAKRYKKARVIALDFALPMLHHVRRRGSWLRPLRAVCADAEQLPLADGSVDLLFSNVTLQWCNDLEQTFSGFLRALRPGGLLMFTTFGVDTLKELRQSWGKVDGHTHVSPFPDMHDVGDALMRAGFADPVVDVEHLTVTYPEVMGLMRDLKSIGAHNVTADRQRGLTGKQRMQAMIEAYEGFRLEGRLPATYEVIYGHAWVPEQKPKPKQRAQNGEVAIPLSSIGRMP